MNQYIDRKFMGNMAKKIIFGIQVGKKWKIKINKNVE